MTERESGAGFHVGGETVQTYNDEHYKKCTRSGYNQVVRPGFVKPNEEYATTLLDFYEEMVKLPTAWGTEVAEDWHHVEKQVEAASVLETNVVVRMLEDNGKMVDELGNMTLYKMNSLQASMKFLTESVNVMSAKLDTLNRRLEKIEQGGVDGKASKGCWKGQSQDSGCWRNSGKGSSEDRGTSSWYSNGKGSMSSKPYWQ